MVLILCYFNPVLNLRSVFGLKSFDEATKLVCESSYPLKEELLNSLMPAIRLSTSRIESAELAFGSSRMGGHPDMPLSLDWPVYSPAKDNQGSCELLTKPLDFIAQINLQEITGFVGSEVLPATGFLYFFFARSAGANGDSAKELGLSKIYFYDGPKELLKPRTDWQGLLNQSNLCSVKFQSTWTVNEDSKIEQSNVNDFVELLESFNDGEQGHQILGYPYPVQVGYDMREICQQFYSYGEHENPEDRDSLSELLDDWQLLLQVDSDLAGPDWMWGDNGCLYFWIKKTDLKRRNFNRHWHVLQSY